MVGDGGECGFQSRVNSEGTGYDVKGSLYRSQIWVVKGAMIKVLEGFHHRVARKVMGTTERFMTYNNR